VIERAIRNVREYYMPRDCAREAPDEEQQKHPGRFNYNKGGGQESIAMVAAGVVCLQEFAQYDDWRIPKNVEIIEQAVREMSKGNPNDPPFGGAFSAYTAYYVAQALYQVGGEPWKRCYPPIRDRLVSSQLHDANPENDGGWRDSGDQISGKEGMLYETAVACFVLAIPNRYLPILQEGKIDSLRKQFEKK
jgi:hypothetical protein